MNKFCQRVITICIIVMTIFSILSYCKINKIEDNVNFIHWRSYALEESNTTLQEIKDIVKDIVLML